MSIELPTEPDYVSAPEYNTPVRVYTTEQARMRLREVLMTAEWPEDGTAEEYFIRGVFPDDPQPEDGCPNCGGYGRPGENCPECSGGKLAQPSSREAIKLAITDALCFTEADDPVLNEDALAALLEGGQLLRDGATEQQEEAWLGRLLAAGFNLVPAATSGG